MSLINEAPTQSYGVLLQTKVASSSDVAVEQIRRLGYAIIDSGYAAEQLAVVSSEFDRLHAVYVDMHGEDRLREVGEENTIRLPLVLGSDIFLELALNAPVLSVVKELILGKFILNQQNGIINPACNSYSQGAWHRDLPYQHFVSSRPLAVNALFCLDDFTVTNGGTYVLPASHMVEAFPSESFIKERSIQVEAKAGSFILLDCMLFHAGGYNRSSKSRRAINHVYTVPYLKQQINISHCLDGEALSVEERALLGFHCQEPQSVEEYLKGRRK